MATLTSRTLAQASAITPTTLIHIVTTADTSQSLAGSSYKAELQQLASIFSGGTFISGNHGAFLSTQDQIIASAGQLKSVSADTTVVSSGITLSANTRYIISNVGNYNIQYTVQVQKTSPVLSNTYIWMQKNGTDIANSTTITTLTGDTIFRVVTKNFIETVTTPNTYYELYWTSDNNDTQLGKETTPPYGIPASPSVYVTINQI